METIVDALESHYFPGVGVPETILTDNGGQFLAARWEQVGWTHGFAIRRTTPYNPHSNPVERVMRELGCIVRVYAHHKHTIWDKVFLRVERVLNETEHRSTGYRPVDLHDNQAETLEMDPILLPEDCPEEDTNTNIQFAIERFRLRAEERKKQADKHEVAAELEPGVKVWVKTHRKSNKRKKLKDKLLLVYEGPYVVRRVVRRNAYLVETLDGNVHGVEYDVAVIRHARER